ncbi:hypothetical protein ACTXT7_009951 [Hymenolepis weldensis]
MACGVQRKRLKAAIMDPPKFYYRLSDSLTAGTGTIAQTDHISGVFGSNTTASDTDYSSVFTLQ